VKILQLITHLELGGAQKATLNLSGWLKSQGYQVVLGCSDKGLLIKEAKNLLGEHFKRFRFLTREINPVYDLIALFAIFIYIREEKFDLIHTHTSKAGFLGRWAAFFAGVKAVHTVHGFAFHDYQNPVTKWLYILLERITAVVTTKIIAVSEQVKIKGLRYKIGKDCKYEVVYELVRFPPVKAAVEKNSSSRVVGMVAALKPQKNPWDFIMLAKKLSLNYPDLEFHILGDGRLASKLKKMTTRLGIEERVKFWGWREEGWKYLLNFYVLVLTSLFEGQPHVVIEAMAMGIPVVAYGVDGVNDVVRDGITGFIVPPRDLTRLIKKVESLLNDDKLREKISIQAFEFVHREKKLNYLDNLSRIEIIYKEVKDEQT
jgi:glycosyltransferase involved in cell wall biosynthesis